MQKKKTLKLLFCVHLERTMEISIQSKVLVPNLQIPDNCIM